MAFLDTAKAYDIANRNIPCEELAKIGMCEKIVNIIRSMYGSTPSVYKLGKLETSWVRSRRGI